jgi:prepilin-type N-terminal cleavage/methylation domain-containing protein
MNRCRNTRAFTLAELLITLIVTSILLAALATLAYAVSSAASEDSDIAVTQAQLRQGTLRLQELIRDCRLVCDVSANYFTVWRADNNSDGAINVNELVCVERENGSGTETLQLCQFASATNPRVTFSAGSLSMTKAQLELSHNPTRIPLIPDCDNVTFTLDLAPPSTRQVTVSFDMTEDNAVNHYEAHTTLRARAGHLLNDAQDTLVSDDDE